MHTSLITFSNELYRESRERLLGSALRYGIGSVHGYDITDIQHLPFYQAHRYIFEQTRGLGYWLWKPLLVAKALAELVEGDVVLYMDAGTELIANPTPLLHLCSTIEPVLLFGNATDNNERWTKRDAFVLMGCDEPTYWHGPHCDASVCLFRKCPATLAFVAEWLHYASNANILTDLPNITGPNLPAYQDHRHDQSILSLLAQRHAISLYRAPSQFGNHYKIYTQRVPSEFNCVSQWDQQLVVYYSTLPYHNSPYGQLVNHHRTKVESTKAVLYDTIVRYSPIQQFMRRLRNKMSSIIQV